MGDDRGFVRILIPAAAFLLLWCTGTARAHQVYVFAWAEGETVHTESYFGGKRKAVGGTIRVYGPSGREIATGETDEDGVFTFPLPGRMDLRIVLDASTGHRAEYLLGTDEIPGAAEEPAEEGGGAGETEAPPRNSAPGTTEEKASTTDAEAIRAVVETALDERLEPVIRSIALLRREQGPGVTEILGGIGYIIGLTGIYLYARSRRRD